MFNGNDRMARVTTGGCHVKHIAESLTVNYTALVQMPGILRFEASDRESPVPPENPSTARPIFKTRLPTLGNSVYIQRILSCLQEEVCYPLPLPSEQSAWNVSYLNSRYHRGDLEAGNIMPADTIEAHCLFGSWHNRLWRSGREDDTQPSERDRAIVANGNSLTTGCLSR